MDALFSLLPGGTLTAVLAAVGAVLIGLWKAFSMGKKSEQAKQSEQRIEAMRDAKEIENEVENLGSNDLDSELQRWLRDK